MPIVCTHGREAKGSGVREVTVLDATTEPAIANGQEAAGPVKSCGSAVLIAAIEILLTSYSATMLPW